MKNYRVTGGTADIGSGELLHLSDAQIKPRLHNLDIIEIVDGGAICRAKTVLQFKVGEVIGMESVPPKAMTAIAAAAVEEPPAAAPVKRAPPEKVKAIETKSQRRGR